MKKGMMSQRLRHYDQIESDCILMLDDDVSLQPESVAKMLAALEENEVDCVGADTFRTHEMPLSMKIYAALTNLVFPHRDDGWAFKIKTNGSFSYSRKPKTDFCLSQSCAGNAMLWRKNTYDKLHFDDELWLDELSFAYGDDMLESYKVYKNGYRLGGFTIRASNTSMPGRQAAISERVRSGFIHVPKPVFWFGGGAATKREATQKVNDFVPHFHSSANPSGCCWESRRLRYQGSHSAWSYLILRD